MTFIGNSIGAINMKNMYNATLEKINQRQRQIILHSVLYYKFNTNIITDETFDKWSRELVQLQSDYKELTKESVFYVTMQGFDGTTGFHLADNEWGITKALHMLKINNKECTRHVCENRNDTFNL